MGVALLKMRRKILNMVKQLLLPSCTILFSGVFNLSSVDQSGFERSYKNKRFVEYGYNRSSVFVI